MDLLSVPSSTTKSRRSAPEIHPNMEPISPINSNSDYSIMESITLFGHKIAPTLQKSKVSLLGDDDSRITKKSKHVQTLGDANALEAHTMKGIIYVFLNSFF